MASGLSVGSNPTPSDQCLHAADLKSVPTAKRSVTHAKTRPTECHETGEFDIYARLEKQSLTTLRILFDDGPESARYSGHTMASVQTKI